jgi:hypothetical protein
MIRNRICLLFLYSSFLFFNLISCKNDKIGSIVSGTWIIDTIIYKGLDVKLCLSVNSLSFKVNDSSCRTPVILTQYCQIDSIANKEVGQWSLSTLSGKEYQITLTNVTSIFSGKSKMYFINDRKNKLLKAKIYTNNLNIIMKKMIFSYDKNEKIINKISKVKY